MSPMYEVVLVYWHLPHNEYHSHMCLCRWHLEVSNSLIRSDTGQDAKVLKVLSRDTEDLNSTKVMERRFVWKGKVDSKMRIFILIHVTNLLLSTCVRFLLLLRASSDHIQDLSQQHFVNPCPSQITSKADKPIFRTAGFEELKLTGSQCPTITAIYLVGYFVMQVPSYNHFSASCHAIIDYFPRICFSTISENHRYICLAWCFCGEWYRRWLVGIHPASTREVLMIRSASPGLFILVFLGLRGSCILFWSLTPRGKVREIPEHVFPDFSFPPFFEK